MTVNLRNQAKVKPACPRARRHVGLAVAVAQDGERTEQMPRRAAGSRARTRRPDPEGLVLGVVRAIVPPAGGDEGSSAHIFAIDTRTHGGSRLISQLDHLDALDSHDMPAGAVRTPRLYAVAGPASRVTYFGERAVGRIRRVFESVAGDADPGPLRISWQRQLTGMGTRFRFDDLLALYLSEVFPESGGVRFPRQVAAPLDGGWRALGLYTTARPDEPVDEDPLRTALEGWLVDQTGAGGDRPWAEHDVRGILLNPAYAYGLLFEPAEDAVATVEAFVRGLADRPQIPTVDSLGVEVQALLDRMRASGQFRVERVPTLLSRQEYLRVLLAGIVRLRSGQPL